MKKNIYNISIYKTLNELSLFLASKNKNIGKLYSFTVVENMIKLTARFIISLKLIYKTNILDEKMEYINKLQYEIELYKSYVDTLNIFSAISQKDYAKFFQLIGNIEFQLDNWEKSLLKKLKETKSK